MNASEVVGVGREGPKFLNNLHGSARADGRKRANGRRRTMTADKQSRTFESSRTNEASGSEQERKRSTRRTTLESGMRLELELESFVPLETGDAMEWMWRETNFNFFKVY